MAIHDVATALLHRSRNFEVVMPKTGKVLFYDDFEDGKLHGWRPTHFGADVPFNPVSVETDFPAPGLFMATGSCPYRAGARSNTVSTYRGLSGQFPTSGIVSFSGEFFIQSGGPDAYAWSAWGVDLDIQNWTNTLRAHPKWQVSNPGDGSTAQWQIADDTLTFHNIVGPNPVNGHPSQATKGLTAGENEAKWDRNYLRVSFDLGDLFSRSTETPSSQYYSMNLNGFEFDLRSQGAGRGKQSVQAGTALSSFAGGLNFGISLYRSTIAGAVYPARLVASQLAATYHDTGWLT